MRLRGGAGTVEEVRPEAVSTSGSDSESDDASDYEFVGCVDVENEEATEVDGDAPTEEEVGEGQVQPHVRQVSTVFFWNGRKLGAGAADWADTSAKWAVSRRKLVWLAEFLATSAPRCVIVAEVDGSVDDLRHLRRWFHRLGYRMCWLRDDLGERGSNSNTMVSAVRAESVRVMQSRKLAARTWGLEYQDKVSMQRFAVVGMHGLHESRPARDGRPRQHFGVQLDAAGDWLERIGGGLLCGDLNHIPCKTWRSGARTLGAGGHDRALRDFTGWRCACCTDAAERPVARGTLVGEQVSAEGQVLWTRRAGAQRARLDVGIDVGGSGGSWTKGGEVEARWFDREGGSTLLSDHVGVEFLLGESCGDERAERRQMPLPFRGRRATGVAAAAQRDFQGQMLRGEARRLRTLRAIARREGKSEAAEAVKRLRAAGEAALATAARREEARRDAVAMRASGSSPKAMYNAWLRRLRKAIELREQAVDPRSIAGGLLFHERTGLSKIRDDVTLSGSQVWEHVLRRCRRELRHARARFARQRQSADREMVRECAALGADPVDAASRIQRVWRLLTARRGNIALTAVHPLDDTTKPVVSKHEDAFLRACGEVGSQIVAKLDEGGCVAAYEAWFERFKIEFDALRGLDGEAWQMSKELPFSVFREVLRGARGKAVGAGGLSLEMLAEAGIDVQVEVYNALMDDVLQETLSPQWKRVLYVLLVKPPPNNPACISGRREIALMPQEMKLFLKMIRNAVYKRVAGRIGHEQWGWCEGVGCVDPGLALQGMIQQTKRHRGRLFVLWMDLATFFPKINRDIDEVGQLLHGLPPEVVRLTRLIYGARSGGVEHATRCQYDTSIGLSEVFYNHVGALMGCPLSTDRAKLLLNSALIAIAAVVKGARVWGSDGQIDWARLVSLAYADDWCGTFETAAQLRKAWGIWVAWEQITGCKLGVKALVKTVCSGVDYSTGEALAVEDPELKLANGEAVPFIPPWCAYKHLGNLRRLDGDDRTAWKGDGVWGLGVRGKL